MRNPKPSPVEWTLRIGAFLCFVGHGAFGIMLKEAWVPYFAVVGIGRETAYALMPWIGTLDVAMGCLVLSRPVPLALVWMTLWALWTAALRPLSGEPFWEALERAGNYGVPAALLILGGSAALATRRRLLGPFVARPPSPAVLAAMRRVLQGTVALLLIGHGALGIIGKHGLTLNYASVMPAGTALAVTVPLGWVEVAMSLAAFAPVPGVLLGVAAWKLATEALFLTAGSPVWELVERGGSYAAPVALALVLAAEGGGFGRRPISGS